MIHIHIYIHRAEPLCGTADINTALQTMWCDMC